MSQKYATAVIELLQSGAKLESVFDGLKNALKKRHHEKLYANILRIVARTMHKTVKRGYPTLTVTNEKDITAFQSQISASLKELQIEEKPEPIISEAIVGGYILTHNNNRIDNSYKTKLVRLYRNITNN